MMWFSRYRLKREVLPTVPHPALDWYRVPTVKLCECEKKMITYPHPDDAIIYYVDCPGSDGGRRRIWATASLSR